MKYKQFAKATELVAGIENATQLVTVLAFADPIDTDGQTRPIDDKTLDFIRDAVASAAAHVGITTHAIAAFARFDPIELTDGENARAKCVVTLEKGAENDV